MQLEHKLVEDRDAAHAEAQQREDVEEHGDDTLPEPVIEALHDAALEHRGKLLGAIRMVLDRQRLEVSQLRMPPRESGALEALQVAALGKSSDLGQFVYASDRRDLLERALGVLQPDLIHADDQTARELAAQLGDLSERVAELRHELTELEDSQDELIEGRKQGGREAAAPGDKPEPRPPSSGEPGDPDAPRPASTLSGPELPEAPRPASTLSGPELPEAPRPASTLSGPELPEAPRPASTLTDPEATPPAIPGASGDGTAADAKQPWWRRPFG